MLTLPRGITRFTGEISGTGTLLVRGSPDGGSTVDINGQSFALPAAGQGAEGPFHQRGLYRRLHANDRGRPRHLSRRARRDRPPAGITTYAGRIRDNGTLTLRTGAAGGGTLVLADGERLVLPAANQTVVYTLANGQWKEDATAAIAANQPFVLENTTVATVGAGSRTINVTGNGALTLSNTSAGTSIVQIAGGPRLVIPPGQSLTTTAANGVWTTDFSAFIAITWTSPSTARPDRHR